MKPVNGWPERPGVPLNPERDGWHWVQAPHAKPEIVLWLSRTERWLGHGYKVRPPTLINRGYRYLGPCLTPAEVAAQVAAAVEAEREACGKVADDVAARLDDNDNSKWAEGWSDACEEIAAAIRARGDAIPGEYQNEAEQERDELFNRLGRVTEELGLSMDVSAGRIIEVIRERVDEEREACASVSVRVDVPAGAETWSPLEAWEEALIVFDEAFRAAIRARGQQESSDAD